MKQFKAVLQSQANYAVIMETIFSCETGLENIIKAAQKETGTTQESFKITGRIFDRHILESEKHVLVISYP